MMMTWSRKRVVLLTRLFFLLLFLLANTSVRSSGQVTEEDPTTNIAYPETDGHADNHNPALLEEVEEPRTTEDESTPIERDTEIKADDTFEESPVDDRGDVSEEDNTRTFLNDDDEQEPTEGDDELETDPTLQQQERERLGIYKIVSPESLRTFRMQFNEDEPLGLVLLTKDSQICQKACASFQQVWHESLTLLQESHDEWGGRAADGVLLGQIVIQSDLEDWIINEWKIHGVPTLAWIKWQAQEQNGDDLDVFVQEYSGSQSSAQALAHGLHHDRLRLSRAHWHYVPAADMHDEQDNNSTTPPESLLSSRTIRLPSIAAFRDEWLRQDDWFGTDYEPQQQLLLDPFLSITEQLEIRDVMGSTFPPVFRLLCQCRSNSWRSPGTPFQQDSYSDFDRLSSVMSKRYDLVFGVVEIESCTTDGFVAIYDFMPSDEEEGVWNSTLSSTWDPVTQRPSTSTTTNTDHNTVSLNEHVARVLRPSIMWMDRQLTAPIAFAEYYSVHAVLFVDLLNKTRTRHDEMKQVIADVSSVCQLYHGPTSRQDTVCLIVPSTETRLLTTFGIDIWSPLDDQVLQALEDAKNGVDDNEHKRTTPTSEKGESRPPKSVLPVLMMTDQRDGVGVERFYLDHPSSVDEIDEFFDSVWAGDAMPAVKSSNKAYTGDDSADDEEEAVDIPTNSHHVHILSSDTIDPFLSRQPAKHSLIVFHAPTCGHCKRFHVIFNKLGQLLKAVKWDTKLQLGRVDVTTNDVVLEGVQIPLLPMLYYFSPATLSTEEEDDDELTTDSVPFLRKEVAAVNDPLEIITWWLDVLVENGNNEEEQALLQEWESM